VDDEDDFLEPDEEEDVNIPPVPDPERPPVITPPQPPVTTEPPVVTLPPETEEDPFDDPFGNEGEVTPPSTEENPSDPLPPPVVITRPPVIENPEPPVITEPEPSQPGRPTTPEPEPSTQYHTVVKGDTLWNISQRYDMTVDALKQLNNLTSNTISIGQRLKVN
jgi:hypothetical protein